MKSSVNRCGPTPSNVDFAACKPAIRVMSSRVPRFALVEKGSEGETSTNCRSNVVVVEIADAGAVRNGDGQTAGDVGIRNAGISVETLGEVMVGIERNLVEGARAGTAETGGGRAGRGNTVVVLPQTIVGQSDVGFAVVSVFHTRPRDLHGLGRIKIVVFDAAQEITALGRGANAQRVRRLSLPDVFVAAKELERVPGILGSEHNGLVVGHDAIFSVVRSDQIGPGDGVRIDAVEGRLIWLRQTLGPQQGVDYADRLVDALEHDVGGELAVVSA